MPLILLAILCWPFAEIAGFIYVGEHIGIIATIGLTLLSSFAGAILLRLQGLAVLQKMQTEIRAGRVPATELGHGALITLAGLSLLVPGFISDILGLLLFLPPVRSLILRLLTRNIHVVVRSTTTRARVVDLDPKDWQDGSTKAGDPQHDHPTDKPRLTGPHE